MNFVVLVVILTQNASASKASFSSCRLTELVDLHYFSWLNFLYNHLRDPVELPTSHQNYLTLRSTSPWLNRITQTSPL